jgi:hypothetical protein
MAGPDPKDGAVPAAADGAGAGVDEIRALEAKLLGMKKDLLFRAAAVDDGGADRSLSFLLVRAGGRLFAAPITQVDEVVEVPSLTPLGEGVRTIAGLCNYHGRMIAVIDVAELSGGARAGLSPEQVLVVCSVPPRSSAPTPRSL